MKRIIILLSIFLLLPAWIQAEIKQPNRTTLSKGLTPYVPEITTDHAPKVRQLAKQLLALIDSMHTEEDFSVQNIMQKTNIQLKQRPSEQAEFYSPEQLNSMWWVVLELSLNNIKQPLLSVDFYSDSKLLKTSVPDMSDTCIDTQKFHKALLNMKYELLNTSQTSKPDLSYRRNDIYINIGYIGQNSKATSHKCIEIIRIRPFNNNRNP